MNRHGRGVDACNSGLQRILLPREVAAATAAIIDAAATAILFMGSFALFIFIGLGFWMKKGTMTWV